MFTVKHEKARTHTNVMLPYHHMDFYIFNKF